jgi:flagellar motor component MotA
VQAARPPAVAPPVVSIGFDAAPPAASATGKATPISAARPAGKDADAPAHREEDHRLDALFDDLERLRDQSGTAALAPLAMEVSDPFLCRGLSLVAAGLPVADLERALDSAMAKQAEDYLDQLMRMRKRLVDLATGS